MTNAAAKTGPTLLERVRGPNARPIDFLVQRGTASALRVNSEYRDFARERMNEIVQAMEGLTPASPLGDWQSLYVMVQDLRSSSATCGNDTIARIARSWERALDQQYRREEKLTTVLQLHMDALKLAVSQSVDGGDLSALADRLPAVVQSLNPTGEAGLPRNDGPARAD